MSFSSAVASETVELGVRADKSMEPFEEPGAFVPPDALDDIATLMIPPQIAKHPETLVRAEAEALVSEGLRGPTGRSLLARDVAISRAHARYYQVLLDHAVDQLGRGGGDPKKTRLYADLLDRQHRRMTASCELLLRLDAPSLPSVQVRADRAAFVLTSEGRSQPV